MTKQTALSCKHSFVRKRSVVGKLLSVFRIGVELFNVSLNLVGHSLSASGCFEEVRLDICSDTDKSRLNLGRPVKQLLAEVDVTDHLLEERVLAFEVIVLQVVRCTRLQEHVACLEVES
jgi:hypothetical protein